MAAVQPMQWVNILADGFTATVSSSTLLAQANTHLANLVNSALESNPNNPSVRLDTSAAVAAEVVAALRQGPAYVLPTDDRRLLAAVKHQLDFLGVTLQPAAAEQQYVVVPSYDLAVTSVERPELYGLLMYSSASRGWANRAGLDDPRPEFLRFNEHEEPQDMGSLAAVIRSEYTGVGEDVIYVVHNGIKALDSAVALTAATMKCSNIRPPPGEFVTICDAAMTSAKDKLYMLGGEVLAGLSQGITPLRTYEPHVNLWFEAQPPSNTHWVTNSALISNKHEGMLLSIGGYSGTAGMISTTESTAPMSDRIAMLDINSGRWTNNPSNCRWPGAAQTRPRYPRSDSSSVSAAAYDEYNIMVVTGVPGEEVRVDVLDLRNWRWREGIAQLRRPGCDSRGVSVVAYEGKVLALGGKRVGGVAQAQPAAGQQQNGGEAQQLQQQQQQEEVAPEEEEEEEEDNVETYVSSYMKTRVREMYSYDHVANAWSSDAVAQLPFGITRAAPVVARVAV